MKADHKDTQSLEALGTKIIRSIREALSENPGKNSAFREWQRKLSQNDRQPRGHFFRKNQSRNPFILFDEGWVGQIKMDSSE